VESDSDVDEPGMHGGLHFVLSIAPQAAISTVTKKRKPLQNNTMEPLSHPPSAEGSEQQEEDSDSEGSYIEDSGDESSIEDSNGNTKVTGE
jgi:hypothetical protein